MSNTKSPEYEKAETYTRLSVPPGAPKVILPKQMDEIVSIPLGFCPLGISNYGGLQFLVAHYWSPAILAVKFSELPDGAEEGGMLDLPLTIPHADASDRTQRAKDILNEILGSGNTAS